MKAIHALLSLVTGLALLPPASSLAQTEVPRGATLPAHPANLLAVLPKPPEGWKVTKSTARNSVAAWFVTDAERHLEKAVFAEGEDPSNPPKTQIKIRDTANFPGYLGPFHNFEPDEEADPKKIMVGSLPAFLMEGSSAGVTVKLLAGQRYVIDLTIVRQPEDNIKKWLQACDFGALAAIRGDSISSAPSEMTIVIIDELNPEKNKTYVESIRDTTMAGTLASIEQGMRASGQLPGLSPEALAAEQAEYDAELKKQDAEAAEEAKRAAAEAAKGAGGANE